MRSFQIFIIESIRKYGINLLTKRFIGFIRIFVGFGILTDLGMNRISWIDWANGKRSVSN